MRSRCLGRSRWGSVNQHIRQRLEELSVTLKDGAFADPPQSAPHIEYSLHQQGAIQMAQMNPSLALSTTAHNL